jgi:hypothetical protein
MAQTRSRRSQPTPTNIQKPDKGHIEVPKLVKKAKSSTIKQDNTKSITSA